MDLAESLRAKGFRQWYERQLIESHMWLVTGFLSLIMTAIAFEMIAFKESLSGLLALMAVGGGGVALSLYAWLRFTRQLGLAEHVAGQATCTSCRTYGKLALVSATPNVDAPTGGLLRVRCRSCNHEWSIG